MNKQQLASRIWASANNMRSKIEANEYKDYILGFIFYKFLSEREEEMLRKEHWSDEDFVELVDDGYDPSTIDLATKALLSDEEKEHLEIMEHCQKRLGYFISYENLFSTWLRKGKDFDVSNVRDALSAFNRLIYKTHKKVFEKIFDTLQTGLSKLGDSSGSQTKAIMGLLELIKDIPMDDKQGYDVLGFIYEYLISMFAANAGKKAGEFYTPHEVSLLMSEIVANHLKERKNISIYDPTSGSGSLLINIGQCVAKYMSDKNNIKYFAQELKDNTYNLTRMNLVMRGILPDNIVARNGDTLEDDWPYFDDNDKERTYEALYVDAVVSNPPYSQKWDPSNKEADSRFARFGLAPKGKADYAFLLHDLYHLKPDGIMTIVLPHGVLFRGGEEEKIRKNLIEQNHIDAIIGLPANIFFGTGIPTIIMVLKQKRKNTDVLIVDASKGFIKVGKNNKLQASDIKKIVDTVIERRDIEKYSRKVSREEIRSNEYNLNIPRYVDSSEKPENWDIYSSIYGGIPNSEINELCKYWGAFPSLKAELFKAINSDYSDFKVDNIKETVLANFDVNKFIESYNSTFSDFDEYLYSELIVDINAVNVSREENVISSKIFKLIGNIPLVDSYKAYQLLDDEWSTVATDLEVIQTEGFECTKIVDPNMVSKKKDGKDIEVQDGWIGHIIPFALIQETKLKDKKSALDSLINRQEAITSRYSEILEEISEDDKESESSLFSEEKDSFVNAEVAKYVKGLRGQKFNDSECFEMKMIEVSKLIDEEKILKNMLKEKTSELEVLTKKTIENLSDDEVIELLKKKWIEPLINSLFKLPNILLNDFISKLVKLSNKYKTTFLDLETQIKESESSLSVLLDELDANEFDKKGLEELKKLLGGE